MPTEDKIKDASTKPRSSSTSTGSSYASSNEDGKTGFRPLADLKGYKWHAEMGKSQQRGVLEKDWA